MDMRWRAAIAVAMWAALLAGCTPMHSRATDDKVARQDLLQRLQAYRRDAASTPMLEPARKVELQQLATDIRAWQARTGQDAPRVTQESFSARMGNGGGGAGCESCPGYRLDGDNMCFLEEEGECPVDDGSDLQIGRVCVYTCIWIGSSLQPGRKGS
jgi:hypothetical protein